jgi:putative sterol carrier protein
MLTIQQPDDLISISLYNVFNYRKNDKKFIKHAEDWNKKIVLHVEPFYPVTVIFEGSTIRFQRGEPEDFDLKVKIHINTMLDIAYGRLTPNAAIAEKRMEIIGLEKDPKVMPKFFNIFVTSMNMVASDPQLHYYEIIEGAR